MSNEDKMSLWNAVCKTNPADTKKVNQRGGFTAICAQSQIKAATEQFGAYGQGWGVTNEVFSMITDEVYLYQANFYINTGDFRHNTSISSSISIKMGNRVDADFAKKVSTDAITKTLSRMGFNSDVFEGKYDDNKYVAQMAEEHKEPEPPLSAKAQLMNNIKALKGDKAGDINWPVYIKALMDHCGEKAIISTVDVNSPMWAKLHDAAVELHTKDV